MLLRITFADGSHRDITTAPDGWKWSTDAITANDLYDGETYDARLQRPWDPPGFDDAHWTPVRATPAAPRPLVASPTPPVRVTDTLSRSRSPSPSRASTSSTSARTSPGGRGCACAGTPATRCACAPRRSSPPTARSTPPPTAARRHRHLHARGRRRRRPTSRASPTTASATSRSPATRAPRRRTASRAASRTRTSRPPGAFESSDTLLNKIWTNNRWGILNNSMSTPTDTPVRDERTPPAMDVQAYADASTREFDMGRFYAKYLEDLPPGTALPTDDAKSQYPDMAGGQVALAWTLYEQYGDRATLAAHYPAMKTFVDRNATEKPSLIWPDNEGFGDWCPPTTATRPTAAWAARAPATASARCRSSTPRSPTTRPTTRRRRRRRSATPTTPRTSAQLADASRPRSTRRFLNAAGNAYGSGRQTTSILPLALGMVPREPYKRSATSLSRTSSSTTRGHLDTGIFGTRYIVDALAGIGRIDLAMTVLDQTTLPRLRLRARPRRDHALGAVDVLLRDGDPRPRHVRRHQRLAVHAARRHPARQPGLPRRRIDPQIPPASRTFREPGHGARHGRRRSGGRRTRSASTSASRPTSSRPSTSPIRPGSSCSPRGRAARRRGPLPGRRRAVVVQHGQDRRSTSRAPSAARCRRPSR